MSRPDSERALKIYKTFGAQTEEVVKFLGVARHFEYATRLEIPNLKHASTDLVQLLEDDLNDPDFDLRRREHRVQSDGRKTGRRASVSKSPVAFRSNAASSAFPSRPQTAPAPKAESKAPAADLIDFFGSIEPPAAQQQPNFQQGAFGQSTFQAQPAGFSSQQTGFAQQPQPQAGYSQQTGFGGGFGQQQETNPFAQAQQPQAAPQQLQAQSTGAGFGGYGPQSYGFQNTLPTIGQNGVANFSQQQQQQQQGVANGFQPQQNNFQPQQNNFQPQQTAFQPQQNSLLPQRTATNPFRASMLISSQTGGSPGGFNQAGQAPKPLSRQDTNPFAKRLSVAPQSSAPPVPQIPPFQQSPATAQQPIQQPQLQPQRTGTNPFARQSMAPPPQQQTLQPLQPNPTGSTNPFRQSAFINQQTGQGWQASGQHGTMGGFEQLDTVPIFPRPGMT